jgi:hypothetical protein
MRHPNAAVPEILSDVASGISLAVRLATAPTVNRDRVDHGVFAKSWAARAARAEHALILMTKENSQLRRQLTDAQHRLDIARRLLAGRTAT